MLELGSIPGHKHISSNDQGGRARAALIPRAAALTAAGSAQTSNLSEDVPFAFWPRAFPLSLSALGTSVGSGEVASRAAGDRVPFQRMLFSCYYQLSPSGIET